jgi:E3 ubiquitin-protein ligase HERC3
VDAYVNYIFQISVHEWYTAFSSGFLKVCGGKVLELFQPAELRAMMVGNSNYDWEELEEVSSGRPRVQLGGCAEDLVFTCVVLE